MNVRLRLLALGLALWATTSVAAAEPPRLIVVISVDQLCQEYLVRFDEHLRQNGGFVARMRVQGARYAECHHAHAFTLTGPGHAVQLTGSYPQQHGIIGNEWYDREAKKSLYCVFDKTAQTVGGKETDGSRSPRNLLATTVADMLKLATNKQAKVYGVALKDRAAILMTGHMADAAYWFQDGNWVTSSYYRQDLPGYIRQFNEPRFADRFAGQEWTLLLEPQKYQHHVQDDYAHENPPSGWTRAFPHALPAEGKELYERLNVSPFGNDMTLAVAREVVIHEQLGQDDIPDILCVNLSSNDYVGHAFGPHSLEVEDMTYRTDRQLGAFLKFLDEHVERYVVALTADHGVAPLPELMVEKGVRRAGRDPLGNEAKVRAQLEPLLRARLNWDEDSEARLVERVESHQLYLAKDHPALAGEQFAVAQRVCRDWVQAQAGVHIAVTREDLLRGQGGGALDKAFARTFHPGRSGDVLWAFEPYYLPGGKGTTHGSPWRYDTHVPLILAGHGIQPGEFKRRVSPAALAPTFAELLGVQMPPMCVEKPLSEALLAK